MSALLEASPCPTVSLIRSPLYPLLDAAARAASSHNTQPWRFGMADGQVRIRPDFSRRCPQVDPDDHHLYASLGCAVENLVHAAQAHGWRTDVALQDLGVHGHAIDIALERAAREPSELANAIAVRQVSRTMFDGQPVPPAHLALLERAGQGSGVSVWLITDQERMAAIGDFVAEGNTAQLQDAFWRAELVDWVRFNEREARRTGDGLYGPTNGSPEVPRALGELVMKLALSPKAQNDKDLARLRSSAGIALFVSDVDDAPHWIEAGRCYERFALQATALGIRNAFINQPIEVPRLRAQFAQWLGIGDRRVDLAVRFGYGPEMPRSPRRPLERVVEAIRSL
jgi:nitroreductase